MRLFFAMLLTSVSFAAFGQSGSDSGWIASMTHHLGSVILPLSLLILIAVMIVAGIVFRRSAVKQEEPD